MSRLELILLIGAGVWMGFGLHHILELAGLWR